ncbi:hypothetical protein [Methylocaldum sp. RMAD-M]|jgi:hypothetical protein|uniref:hypothetical protein n=1 Tax=Methylocaldum sp. RMAD-M TaxID=2806557 RepID=UPI001B53E516|nr:hypothetical protein [Methylocaldum sp. RMAD-M]MBP1151865.1 hypothetical protein [Methylocaldum sp. RMAD-M]
MDEAERLCSRIILMDHGQILTDQTPDRLIQECIEPRMLEVYGDDVFSWHRSQPLQEGIRFEQVGETFFCYGENLERLVRSLDERVGIRYSYRPSNLEDVFLKLTGGSYEMIDALCRWVAVWRRNALVWRKSIRTALLGGFAEPIFYLFALGYGLGAFIGEIEGLSYLAFLNAGILSTSAMNAAMFEGLYLAYTRMEVLLTWDGMLAAPLGIEDVVIGGGVMDGH